MTHYWRVRKWRPDRYGHPCRVVARGTLNTFLVEFADGEQLVTSRWFVRKLNPRGSADGQAERSEGVD